MNAIDCYLPVLEASILNQMGNMRMMLDSDVNEYPSCAVLLAAFNGERWLNDQIETIFRQQNVSVVVFISVDLSTDSTLLIAQAWAIKDKRIRLLPHGERFGSAGRNFFRLIKDVDTSSFDIVAFSDQDDLWFDFKLQRAWEHITSGKCDVYSSDVFAFWKNGNKSLVKKSFPQRKFDHFFEAAGPGCTYVLSANVYEAVAYFVRKNYYACGTVLLHDWFIYAFCRENKYSWFIDDKPTMLYRQHLNNQMGANTNWLSYSRRLKSVSDRWYRVQVTVIMEIVARDLIPIVMSRKFMLMNFRDLRRRPRDQVILFILVFFQLF